tara:strand:- start:57115 stop:57438 length:324 start_codon:yes stop_codon:yes gene_type:complete
MNGNTIKIAELRVIQAQKKKEIKSLKRRMRRNMFMFSLILVIISLILLEFAYFLFGDSVLFLLVILSILVVFLVTYKIIVTQKVKQKEDEIKKIRAKLYRLMKLEDD